MIEIKLLTKKLLFEYISSEDYNALEFVPITKHRALSQIQNPRADDKDVLLLLAFEGKKLIGYLGVLPDQIFFNNRMEKCGCLSCVWVHPSYLGKQIAQLLLNKCYEVWDKRILATEFTKSAENLYKKTKIFNDLQVKKGIRLYIRSDLTKLLPPKNKIFEKSIFFLKIFDSITNCLLDMRFLFLKTKVKYLSFEYNNQLDNEVENFISDKQQHEFFKRGINELNWIINNPWVLSSPEKDSIDKKYYFSSSDKSFNFYALKVRNSDNQLIAFIIFSKRNQSLKLLYCYYKTDIETMANIIYFHILKWKINTFTTFQSQLASYLNDNKTPALLKREIKSHYIISKVFSDSIHLSEFEIQDGDADCSFT